MNKEEKLALKKQREEEKLLSAQRKQRDKELESTSKNVRKHTKKELIVTTVVTAVILIVLIGVSTALSLFILNPLDADDLYDYSALKKYFDKEDISFDYLAVTSPADSDLYEQGVTGVVTIGEELHVYYFNDIARLNAFGDDSGIRGKDRRLALTGSETTGYYYIAETDSAIYTEHIARLFE